MVNRRKRGTDSDPFDTPTSEADFIYGDNDLMPTAASLHIATQIDIFKLFADRTQPRRAVPLSIRGDWDGSARSVPDLLRRWHEAAEKELSQDIKVAHIFKDQEIEINLDPRDHPISDKFMSLVYLADGIRRDGLLNPIQVHRVGDAGYIVAGERRWLAHHLLVMFSGNAKKWGTIAAVDSDVDVWAQAQENGNRSPLNAIEMARQLALLIMDIHADREDTEFDKFDALVSAGGCDRRFYAQVANGSIYHVKGFTDKILGATGLKSRHQISQYRSLLNLSDEEWMQADTEGWTENYCRVNFLQKSTSQTSTTVEPLDDENEEEGLTTVKPLDDEIDEQTLTTVNVATSNAVEKGVQVGQIRATDSEEFPYLVVLEKETDHMFLCEITYRNGNRTERMSRVNLERGWRVVRGFAVISADPNHIQFGQVRAHYEDKDIPYMHVIEDIGNDDWVCDRVYAHGIQRVDVTGDTLRETWTRLLDYIPNPPMTPPTNLKVGSGYSTPYTPPATEDRYFTPVNPGVPKTDTPKGVESPMGTKYVGKPQHDDGDGWDTSINPQHRPPSANEAARTIGSIPMLNMNQKMRFLLSNWMNMAKQLDMRKEYDELRIIAMWTPEYLGDVENAKQLMDGADVTLKTILDTFNDHLARYFNDVLEQIAALDNQDGE